MTPTRRAVVADAESVTDVARLAYEVYIPRFPEGMRPGPMDTDYRAAISDREVWVSEVDERIAGYLILRPRADHVLLENVAVHPDFQRRGIGKTLLTLAETRAGEFGRPEVRLFTHVTMVENQRLYERVGYAETHRSTDNGFELVFYAKSVAVTPQA